jgi:hypothetical protein
VHNHAIHSRPNRIQDYKPALHINIVPIPTEQDLKILGLSFEPKLTYNSHIKNTEAAAKTSPNLLKVISSKEWGKQKETLITSYKAITRPHLEYACTIWGPIASKTNIGKLETIQNSALRLAIRCTKDTNIQHLREETEVLPVHKHIQLHAAIYRQKSQQPGHTSRSLTTTSRNLKPMKQTIFNNHGNFIHTIPTDPTRVQQEDTDKNCKTLHTFTVQEHISEVKPNKILNTSHGQCE